MKPYPARARLAFSLLLATAAVGIAGAASAARDQDRLTPRQAERLEKALAGRTPGKPVSCVSRLLGSDGLQAVSDTILLYRVNRSTVYRNDLNGRCTGLSTGGTLLLKPTIDQYCSGDIARVIDTTTRMQIGSCGLGPFVPYSSAPTGH